jgi:hypothetical protein
MFNLIDPKASEEVDINGTAVRMRVLSWSDFRSCVMLFGKSTPLTDGEFETVIKIVVAHTDSIEGVTDIPDCLRRMRTTDFTAFISKLIEISSLANEQQKN